MFASAQMCITFGTVQTLICGLFPECPFFQGTSTASRMVGRTSAARAFTIQGLLPPGLIAEPWAEALTYQLAKKIRKTGPQDSVVT